MATVTEVSLDPGFVSENEQKSTSVCVHLCTVNGLQLLSPLLSVFTPGQEMPFVTYSMAFSGRWGGGCGPQACERGGQPC